MYFRNQVKVRHIIIFFIISMVIPGFVWGGKLVDRIVAVVNTEAITLSELNQEAAPFLNRIRKEVPDSRQESQIKQAKQEVLEKMIDQELIRQEAENEHISVSDEEVDTTLARIAESNNRTVEEIENELRSSGASLEDYRENIRLQILRSKLVGQKIRAKTVVTDEQIEDYYQKIYGNSYNKEGYHLLQFAAGWDSKGRHESREEARKYAEKMRRKIKNGANFSEITREHSDLPSASEGGDIGVFGKNELAPYMWQSIKELQPGELSPVIETGSGFQFFLLLGSKNGNVSQKAPLKMVRQSIREKLYRKSLEKRFENWTKELQEKAYIKKML
ncbi:MAG: SurA N-terminal domain-containing protein [Desulfobia sp.]